MTEHELLQLSAKAMGFELEYRHGSDAFYYDDPESGREQWNPLSYDLQAMRLAVELQLSIQWFTNLQYVMVERRGFGENIGWTNAADRGGALRQALTVVAAQIGSTLPCPQSPAYLPSNGVRAIDYQPSAQQQPLPHRAPPDSRARARSVQQQLRPTHQLTRAR